MNKIISKLLSTFLISSMVISSQNSVIAYGQNANNDQEVSKIINTYPGTNYFGTIIRSVNMRTTNSTSGKIITYIKKNSQVYVLKKMSNNWYQVNYNNNIGYISGSYLKLHTKFGTTTSSVNMRTGNSSAYNIIAKLKKNTEVEVIRKMENDWYQIKYNGKIGYISSKYLKVNIQSNSDGLKEYLSNTTGTIKSTVNMRTGPSTSYKSITKLKANSEVEVIYETSKKYFKWTDGWYELKGSMYSRVSPSSDKIKSNTWCKIKYNGKTGYINSKYINIKSLQPIGVPFGKMKSKMDYFGFESLNIDGYNFGFRNQHFADKYNIFDNYVKTNTTGFDVEIMEFTEESSKSLKECLDLLLPTKSNEVYNEVKELATTNGMRDSYRRLYVDGRSIAIHKYTGSRTFVVIENQK